jgi:hypothetical protein
VLCVSVFVSDSVVSAGSVLELGLECVDVADSDDSVLEVSLGCGLGFTIDVGIAEDVTVTLEVMITILVEGGGGAAASCRGCKKNVGVDEDGCVLSTSALRNALVAVSAAVRGKCMVCSRLQTMCARGST